MFPLLMKNLWILFLKNKSYSHLILGCTHYPIIKDFIEAELNLKTIDPHEVIITRIVKLTGLVVNERMDGEFYYNPKLGEDWDYRSIDFVDI